jgi:hypothetical protein
MAVRLPSGDPAFARLCGVALACVLPGIVLAYPESQSGDPLIFANSFEPPPPCVPTTPPSAFEIPSNGEDDDCDGSVDEPRELCDLGLPSNSASGSQYAAAFDLCQATTEPGVGWGLVSASFALASGTGTPAPQSRSIRSMFGSGSPAAAGSAMAVLSTGVAAAPSQTNPNHVAFQPGSESGTQSAAPIDWLAANGGAIPVAPGCPSVVSTTAIDPILLSLRIRVPTNANSFRFSARVLASDYPEWTCSNANDVFVALLDSAYASTPHNPLDRNLARYTAAPGQVYPLGVNLAAGNTGLFTQCLNGNTGCAAGAVAGVTSTCVGTAGLAGSGMDVLNPMGIFGQPGFCGVNNLLGGGTDWLLVRGNVVPGEVITLRLAVWDVGDGFQDTVILLDDFQWSRNVFDPGVSPP